MTTQTLPTRWAVIAGLLFSAALLLGCPGERSDRLSIQAALSGANEVPPVATPGTGTLEARLEDRQLEISGTFFNLESDLQEVSGSPAHVHDAPAGSNGPILFNVDVESADRRNGTFSISRTLTEDEDAAFRDGRYYFNLHTATNPGGELRVQLQEDQPLRTAFTTDLAGSKEVPPVPTGASGSANVELVENVLVLTGTFEGLESELLAVSGSPAHVHQAPEGQNGPIILPVEVTPAAGNRSGAFRLVAALSDDQKQAFDAGELYVNIHTIGRPAGEIRAQLMAPPTLAQ